MFDLNRLFENWLDDPEFSVTEKLSFGDKTRASIAKNNPDGVFNEVLALLDTALAAAGGATGTESVAVAVRIAAVQSKVTMLASIKTLISQRSGRISDKYKKGSPTWLEFFPQGVTAYRRMTETQVAASLDVIIAAAKKYDADMYAEFTTLKANWIATKTAAGDQIAEADTQNLTQDQAMTQLELVLMKVFFTAALAFTGNPAMGKVLFDQSLLYNPVKTTTPTPPPAPAP